MEALDPETQSYRKLQLRYLNITDILDMIVDLVRG